MRKILPYFGELITILLYSNKLLLYRYYYFPRLIDGNTLSLLRYLKAERLYTLRHYGIRFMDHNNAFIH